MKTSSEVRSTPCGPGAAGRDAASGSLRAEVSIVLNGERRSVEDGLSVADLLSRLGLSAGMVVVERNREILARRTHADTPVEEGDRFEIVHFVGGG